MIINDQGDLSFSDYMVSNLPGVSYDDIKLWVLAEVRVCPDCDMVCTWSPYKGYLCMCSLNLDEWLGAIV